MFIALVSIQVGRVLWKLRQGGRYYDFVMDIPESAVRHRIESVQISSLKLFGKIVWDLNAVFNGFFTNDNFYVYGADRDQTKKLFLIRHDMKWSFKKMNEVVMHEDFLEIRFKKTVFFQDSIFIRHSMLENTLEFLSEKLR